jgi:hypothetical protein
MPIVGELVRWRRSYERLAARPGPNLVGVAASAVLARLRALPDRTALRQAYADDLNGLLTLAEGLLGPTAGDADDRRRVADDAFDALEAAFWLRWRELEQGEPISTRAR